MSKVVYEARFFVRDQAVGKPIYTIPCLVNGHDLGELLIDSGANQTILDRENIERWHLENPGKTLCKTLLVVGGGKLEAQPFKLKSLSLGNCFERDYDVLIADIFPPADVLLAGVLGNDFFSRFDRHGLQVDGTHGWLTLERDT